MVAAHRGFAHASERLLSGFAIEVDIVALALDRPGKDLGVAHLIIDMALHLLIEPEGNLGGLDLADVGHGAAALGLLQGQGGKQMGPSLGVGGALAVVNSAKADEEIVLEHGGG